MREQGSSPAAPAGPWQRALPLIVIAVATLAAYSRLPGNQFVVYDDPEYITENRHILSGLTWDGIVWAFTSIYEGNWHPLTWLSHMLDVELFGLNPAGHHGVALGLHLANALLLCTTLARLTGARWRSLAVALLFALHPLRVESVAWAAERKDLLSALFWLLTIRAWHSYVQRPGWRRYLPVAVLFGAGLLAKQMIVTLPLVLLLLDYWPQWRLFSPGGVRLRRAMAEKLPLLLLAAAAGVVTYQAQTRGAAVVPLGHASLGANVSNALQGYVTYLGKTFWPTDLAILYPYDSARLTPWRTAGAAVLLLAVTVAVLRAGRRRPYLAVGWLWYLGALLPVIGFVRIGIMSVADRYTYLPQIGLFIMICWGLADLAAGRPRLRRLLAGATAAVLILLACLTSRQLRYWHDGIALMEHAVAVTDDNWFAYNNLGASYILVATQNRAVNIAASLPLAPDLPQRRAFFLQRALLVCTEAVRLEPSFPLAHYNLGLIHLNLGDRQAALAEYDALLHLRSGLAPELRRLIR
jgi:tetratricopeptide (TPR) repeat protein